MYTNVGHNDKLLLVNVIATDSSRCLYRKMRVVVFLRLLVDINSVPTPIPMKYVDVMTFFGSTKTHFDVMSVSCLRAIVPEPC